jgi:hypothetical protein
MVPKIECSISLFIKVLVYISCEGINSPSPEFFNCFSRCNMPFELVKRQGEMDPFCERHTNDYIYYKIEK